MQLVCLLFVALFASAASFSRIVPVRRLALRRNKIDEIAVDGLSNNAIAASRYVPTPEEDIEQLIQKFLERYSRHTQAISEPKHLVQEQLKYIPRPVTTKAVVDAFKERSAKRNLHPSTATDKANNKLVVLPGSPGSGKSSFLAHLPESAEYCQYAGAGFIEILLSFNGMMPGLNGLGVRMIYGAIISHKGLAHSAAVWADFAATMKHHNHISGRDALYLIRRLLPDKGPRSIVCVDELSKAYNDVGVVTQLGDLLDYAPDADVVVTSLTPSYVQNLVAGSQRRIVYLPLEPLPASHHWEQYSSSASAFLSESRKKMSMMPKDTRTAFNFKARLLMAAPILASGHPRTIEVLIDDMMQAGPQWQRLLPILRDKNSTAGEVLRYLCGQKCFTLFFKDALTDEERDFILSAEEFDIDAHPVLRDMIEGNRCGTFTKVSTTTGFFTTTTNLAAFFRMVQTCNKKPSESLGVKSSLVRSIFGSSADLDLAALWERARALTLAIRAYEASNTCQPSLERIYGVDNFLEGSSGTITDVRCATEGEKVVWERGMLVIGSAKQSGWDLLLSARDSNERKIYVMEEIKVNEPSEGMERAVARKIMLAVADRFAAEGDAEEGDLMSRIYMVFSVFEDIDFSRLVSAEKLLARMGKFRVAAAARGDQGRAKDWERAEEYVCQVYNTNVCYLGKRDMDNSMPAVLLPIAALVARVASPENSKEIP